MSQSLKDAAHPLLPEYLLQRLPLAQETAEAHTQVINDRLKARNGEFSQRLSSVQDEACSKKGKLHKLRKLASDMGKLTAGQTACKKGCTHCCHIPVALFQGEANLIAEEIKRPAQQLITAAKPSERGYGYHQPCTFLRGGSCSIYDYRPLSCRVHFNLDSDALLCELLPEMAVPVPLLNMSALQEVYVQLSVGEVLADIRDFFPPQRRQSGKS